MIKKERKIKLRGVYARFERVGDGKAKIKFRGANSKENYSDVEVTLGFDCLPYIMRDIRNTWNQERTSRIEGINSVDRALGTNGV